MEIEGAIDKFVIDYKDVPHCVSILHPGRKSFESTESDFKIVDSNVGAVVGKGNIKH